MATVKVKIPGPLQKLTDNQGEVECSGSNIIEMIDNLDGKFSGFKERVSENGKLRRFVNFYVNGEDIRFGDNEKTEIKDGDEVSIVPAIAGG